MTVQGAACDGSDTIYRRRIRAARSRCAALERLNAYHVGLSPSFAEELAGRTFADRREELLGKSREDALRVDLASCEEDSRDVGYCVTTIASRGAGEIDSIFVVEDLRGRGVGSRLMQRALEWLAERGVRETFISVAGGNQRATAFYAKFGFFPRATLLQQKVEPRERPEWRHGVG